MSEVNEDENDGADLSLWLNTEAHLNFSREAYVYCNKSPKIIGQEGQQSEYQENLLGNLL